ncbi:MAG: CbbQ/NirQ/NorQ C-terminal domain-containing protein [Bilophila wadsworthia]
MGDADSYENTIEVTLSTRTLIRWADLALKFQPLANQGIEPLPMRWIVLSRSRPHGQRE